ncbi:hypothetical protein J7L48_09435 [bacterium]|nr:hypothetical protein [bacterium]
MRKSRLIILFAVLLLLLLSTCGTGPDFEIVKTVKETKSYGSPYVKITVRNIGDGIGYNVSCDVLAKRGNNIVDSGFAYFANGANIEPGESATDEAVFFDLSSHSNYDNLKYELDWLSR